VFCWRRDERTSAPPVIVIGYDLWQERFGGDPGVLGRTVRLGRLQASVVGVMPRGFSFPAYQDAWIPLRGIGAGIDAGPAVRTFGRLAPGVTLEQARSELNRPGLLAAASPSPTYEHLRVEVVPYASSIVALTPDEIVALRSANVGIVLLVVLVFGNVALLTFARAATREGEIVVRSALGASRARITTQLFAEALALGGVGLAVGLAAARYGMGWALFIIGSNLGDPPYWVNDSLSGETLLYAAGLTVLAALVAGVVPALRVTRAVGRRLRRIGAGSGGLHFGGFWTAVIVCQVAVTVTLPVTALLIWRSSEPIRTFEVAFPEQEYLVARLVLDEEGEEGEEGEGGVPAGSREAYATRVRQTLGELERRLSGEPTVRGVTFADRLPHLYHPERRIDVVEDVPSVADSAAGRSVKTVAVATDYLDLLDAPILAGRGFRSADVASGARIAIANESFVAEVLGGRNPIGRRFRFVADDPGPDRPSQPPEPWYEMVGVVRDLGMYHEGGRAGLYLPLAVGAPGTDNSVYLMVRLRGDPVSFAARAREISHGVDPTLRIYEPRRLDELGRDLSQMIGVFVRTALIASLVALFLSLAAVYSILSFAVSRRTSEIGIRVALGAGTARVVLALFRQPLGQITLGVLVGALLVSVLVRSSVGALTAREILLMGAYAAVMMGVCLVAGAVPTRRALRIEPSDALRED
jgi:predicted permease